MKQRTKGKYELEAFRLQVVQHAGNLQDLLVNDCTFCRGVAALVLALAQLTPSQLEARAREYFENVHE